MKRIILYIPTTRRELKDFALEKIKWFVHPLRMRHNKQVLNELASEICNEISSGYWRKDISDVMKERLTDPVSGKIRDIVRGKMKELI